MMSAGGSRRRSGSAGAVRILARKKKSDPEEFLSLYGEEKKAPELHLPDLEGL
jgi:hypothetical protein